MSTLVFEQTQTNTFLKCKFFNFYLFFGKTEKIFFFSFEFLSSTLRDLVTKEHGLTPYEDALK